MDRRKRAVCKDFRLDRGRSERTLVEIEIVDGLKIAALNDLRDLATWVLFEQEDWFEPEIAWLRRVVRPGWQILDAAPGCGVLAASMAKCAGPAGGVVVLEPDARARERLQSTRSANGLACLEIQAAPVVGASAELAVFDAENRFDVLRMGQDMASLLAERSPATFQSDPLLMIRLEPDSRPTGTTLGQRLQTFGYDLYHHLAGFEVAVPLDVGFTDNFALNLIACRPERAADLAARGLMIVPAEAAAARAAIRVGLDDLPSSTWPEQLALAASCLVEDEPPAGRIALAERLVVEWLGRIRDFVDLIDRPARLIALARLLAACGARVAALEALRPLLHRLETGALVLDEPTIAISAPFDPPAHAGNPAPSLRIMGPYGRDDPGLIQLKLSIVATMCRLMAHSSCIAGAALQPILSADAIKTHLSPELERRRQLMALRSGAQTVLEATPALLRSRNHRFAASKRPAA